MFAEDYGGQQVANELLWQLTDHQGTVRDVTSIFGKLRRHVEYDSFGNVLSEQHYNISGQPVAAGQFGAVDQLFYYTGQERDPDTGLQLHGARWYAAVPFR